MFVFRSLRRLSIGWGKSIWKPISSSSLLSFKCICNSFETIAGRTWLLHVHVIIYPLNVSIERWWTLPCILPTGGNLWSSWSFMLQRIWMLAVNPVSKVYWTINVNESCCTIIFKLAEHSLPYSDVTIYIFAISYLSSMLYVYRFLWPLCLGWLLVWSLYKEVYLQIFKRVFFW